MSGAICLAAGVLYTLAWTHSVEKVVWEEDWVARKGKLVIVEARVQGSGAGMEPGPEAVLRDGFWHWRPKMRPIERLVLTESYYAQDYRFCHDGNCFLLSDLVPGEETVELTACDQAKLGGISGKVK